MREGATPRVSHVVEAVLVRTGTASAFPDYPPPCVV
jgi:hypothetical protein